MPTPLHLPQLLQRIPEPWQPHIIGSVNGQELKLAKLAGAFEWHHHATTDELFYVIQGTLIMHIRAADGTQRTERIPAGSCIVIPKGVEHLPETEPGEEVHVLLLEATGTINTGNLPASSRTVAAKRLD